MHCNNNNTLFFTFLTILLAVTCLFVFLNSNKRIENSVNIAKNKTNQQIPNKLKYHIPKFMLELYETSRRRTNSKRNSSTPEIVRSVIPKHTESIDEADIEKNFIENHLLVFDLPPPGEGEEFVSAELRILTIVDYDLREIAGVERQLSISVYDERTKKLRHLQKLHVYHANNTWITFNLTQPVIDLMGGTGEDKFDTKCLKVVISMGDYVALYQQLKQSLKLSLMPVVEGIDHEYPILLLSYSSTNNNSSGSKKLLAKNPKEVDNNIPRKKRSLEEDYEEETNHIFDDDIGMRKTPPHLNKKRNKFRNTCRRKPLYVNFADIQYDLWIVQPAGYEAFQCQGKCFYPVADHLNPTKHAIVQALVHSMAPAKASRSCCVPTSLDSISILYVDERGVLTYRLAYKDMVVVECGCR